MPKAMLLRQQHEGAPTKVVIGSHRNSTPTHACVEGSDRTRQLDSPPEGAEPRFNRPD
jgi:hypothetical protein